MSLVEKYEDPTGPGTLAGINKFVRRMGAKQAEVKKELLGSEAYSLHHRVRRRFPRARVVSLYPGQHWQADLIDFSAISKQNNHQKFLLVAIDVLTKFAYVEPIKNKSGQICAAAMEAILERAKTPVQHLSTDAGKEFLNAHFPAVLRRREVKHVISYSDVKCSVAERFNRTLKSMIWRFFTATGTFRYVNKLKEIVSNYNNSYHRSIKMNPADVDESNFKSASENLYGLSWPGTGQFYEKKDKQRDLKPGMTVRISRKKEAFDKGFTPNWTRELFIIDRTIRRKPKLYKLRDLQNESIIGSFYREELLPYYSK